MKYARQAQEHLDRLDQSLAQLRDLIKRGEIDAALHYMEEGLLKESMEWCNKQYEKYLDSQE